MKINTGVCMYMLHNLQEDIMENCLRPVNILLLYNNINDNIICAPERRKLVKSKTLEVKISKNQKLEKSRFTHEKVLFRRR